MTTLMGRTLKHLALIKAVREIRKEIEKAGLDELKIKADNGISIISTYLNDCSPKERARYRRDLNALLQMGVTPDMLLDELARQMPEIAPIMDGKDDYKKTEIQNLERFLKQG